jgi:nucleoside transporter
MGGAVSYASVPDSGKTLDPQTRVLLSTMMFLQFAVWGSWFVVLGPYLVKLGFTGAQIGDIYGTMALGAILSTMLVGQLADRCFDSEKLMGVCHLVGAGLLYAMSQITDPGPFYWVALAYALVYNPTLALSNSISFANIPDATRDFPSLRVLGTIGWIAANLAVDFALPAGAAETNMPLIMAAGCSAVLGVFSFFLPHTPPTGKPGEALPFLRAFGLLGDPSFGVFFAVSFVITIALAFYYGFTGVYLGSLNVAGIATTMALGQVMEIGFMLVLPFALRGLGMKWVLVVGMAAWALRYGLFSIGDPYILVLIGIGLHGVCFDFFLAAGFIHTDNKAPAAIRGSAQALFSFLTYGVGMWIGNMVSGRVVDAYTVEGVADWSSIWMVPAIGAAVCLGLFILLFRDTPGKVDEQPAADAALDKPVAPAEAPGQA